MQVVQRVHLTLALRAGRVCSVVEALDLHSYRDEKPDVEIAPSRLAGNVSRRHMLDLCKSVQKRRR
jgi:hypothetical protein